LESPTASVPAPLPPPNTGPNGTLVGATAQQQLEAAQLDLQQLQTRLTPEHPDVVRARRKVTDLQKKADEEALARPLTSAVVASPAELLRQRRLADAKAELEKMDKQIADKNDAEQKLRGIMGIYQKRIEAAPARDGELTELTRDYRTLQTMYTSLLAKKEDSKVAANLERRQIGEQFKILDAARLPERPTSPNRQQLHLVGVGIAVCVGLALAALMEYLDKSLRSEMDVRAALNLVVLAGVPVLQGPGRTSEHRWKVVAFSAAVLLVAAAGTAAVVWRVWR